MCLYLHLMLVVRVIHHSLSTHLPHQVAVVGPGNLSLGL
jgi:hypothetical protein